jgi:DNA polymerase-3 subunit alpha (Gram-positive type)
MRACNVPEWYINSCKKIKYMFPKAHAAAYVMMAFRIAWFKVHIPKAYYAAYFSIRAKAFDAEFMIFGKEKVKEKMKEIEMLGMQAAPKDKDMYDDLEIVLEMYERNIKFLPIDLYKSHTTKFLVEEDSLRPPINSISGMGNVAAEGIFNAVHEEEPISSIEDLRKRAKIGNASIDLLKKFCCLNGLPESDQMSFFDAI